MGRLRARVIHAEGFTLIEMMITLAVAAILLGLSVPSFKSLLENNRAASTANDLLASLQYARSEAVKRAKPAFLCPSTNGETCTDGDTDWHVGWIVVADLNKNNTPDEGEVMRVTVPFPPGVVITGPSTVLFQAAGNVLPGAFALDVGDAEIRSICMEASGRSKVKKAANCS